MNNFGRNFHQPTNAFPSNFVQPSMGFQQVSPFAGMSGLQAAAPMQFGPSMMQNPSVGFSPFAGMGMQQPMQQPQNQHYQVQQPQPQRQQPEPPQQAPVQQQPVAPVPKVRALEKPALEGESTTRKFFTLDLNFFTLLALLIVIALLILTCTTHQRVVRLDQRVMQLEELLSRRFA